MGKALLKVEEVRPFRGPSSFVIDDWEYSNRGEGTIVDFSGIEIIFFKGKQVFKQNFFGGLVLPKE